MHMHQDFQRQAPWATAPASTDDLTITLTPEQANILRNSINQSASRQRNSYQAALEESEHQRDSGEWDPSELITHLDDLENNVVQTDALAWLINAKLDDAQRPSDTLHEVRDRQRMSREHPPTAGSPIQPAPTGRPVGQPPGAVRSFMARLTGLER